MKAVVQRVKSALLSVDGETISQIQKGLVVYFCVEKGDAEEMLNFFANKISNLRIFEDEDGKMNLNVKEVSGEILLISQFTLTGDVRHGFRPSFTNAEEPKRANELYLKFAGLLKTTVPTKLGVFGADMKILQENDGPVTIIITK